MTALQGQARLHCAAEGSLVGCEEDCCLAALLVYA